MADHRDFRILLTGPKLDAVRRTGHQQAGRVEERKSARAGGYSIIHRQHKDYFIVLLHDVVIVVLFFRDYDGTLQVE